MRPLNPLERSFLPNITGTRFTQWADDAVEVNLGGEPVVLARTTEAALMLHPKYNEVKVLLEAALGTHKGEEQQFCREVARRLTIRLSEGGYYYAFDRRDLDPTVLVEEAEKALRETGEKDTGLFKQVIATAKWETPPFDREGYEEWRKINNQG